MRHHLPERLTLAELAREIGWSESGLVHAYRRQTGHGPISAVRGLRIEAARQRLLADATR